MNSRMGRFAAALAAAILIGALGLGCAAGEAAAPGGELATAEQAAARAKELLGSGYLDTPGGAQCVPSQVGGGLWRVEAAEGEPTPTLLMDREGRIVQLTSPACTLPSLAVGADSVEGMDEIVYSEDKLIAMDQMFRELCGLSFDAVCCYGADETAGVYYYRFNEFEAYAAVRLAPSLRLLAFGDLRVPDVNYGDYLSGRQALALARQGLARAYGLEPGAAEELAFRQMDFSVDPGRWTEEAVPVPYWFVVLNESEDFSGGDYTVLVDAATGDVVETRDPATSGKG